MGRLRFLDEVSTRHPAGTVLAVSHENPIVAVLCLSSANPQLTSQRGIANCEWVELEWPAAT